MVVGSKTRCFEMRLENERFVGPDTLQEVERQVRMVRANLQIA
jgi:hypothetical protein